MQRGFVLLRYVPQSDTGLGCLSSLTFAWLQITSWTTGCTAAPAEVSVRPSKTGALPCRAVFISAFPEECILYWPLLLLGIDGCHHLPFIARGRRQALFLFSFQTPVLLGWKRPAWNAWLFSLRCLKQRLGGLKRKLTRWTGPMWQANFMTAVSRHKCVYLFTVLNGKMSRIFANSRKSLKPNLYCNQRVSLETNYLPNDILKALIWYWVVGTKMQ